MNKNQTHDHETRVKGTMGVVGDEATADKSSGKKGKPTKKGGKPGAVLGEINDDPKKKQK